VSGEARSYVLVVPGSYSDASTYPLLIAMHGDGGDGPQFHSAWPLENASGQSAIIAYPSGKANTWDLYTPVDQDKDVAFLVQLVDALRARFKIGSAYALGMSSGAFMANQMACRRPSLFRGIVSHSGGSPDEPNSPHGYWSGDYVQCNGQTTGVAAMIIHGTADTTVPFPSGEHDANYWATVNGCASGYTASSPSPCQARNGCPGDKPVVYCPIDGLGHALWDQSASAAWSFISSL
jgi:polyhydroxybutyrate depolymerase